MKNRVERNELHYAAVEGRHNDVARLLAEGVDPDVADANGFTALHFAAQSKHPAIVVQLLEAGAAVDPVNMFGNSPLWVAAMKVREESRSVTVLLAAGADSDLANNSGNSPRSVVRDMAARDIESYVEESVEDR